MQTYSCYCKNCTNEWENSICQFQYVLHNRQSAVWGQPQSEAYHLITVVLVCNIIIYSLLSITILFILAIPFLLSILSPRPSVIYWFIKFSFATVFSIVLLFRSCFCQFHPFRWLICVIGLRQRKDALNELFLSSCDCVSV